MLFVPYNVDRPARCTPWVTYSLMGINTFIFLVTVFVALVYLPVDRLEGESAVDELIKRDPAKTRAKFRTMMDRARGQGVEVPADVSDEQIDEVLAAPDSKRLRNGLAAALAMDNANTVEGYKQYWQIENLDSRYVLEPHYSVLNLFAYRAGNPSVAGKLLSLMTAMFLHGGFMHLFGNMLMLWVFGRALEDFLGWRIYLGSYLLCGVAATLLFHVMTMIFTPQQMNIPSLGASGAIAGVMGMFAPRFYRTPVRVFYMLPWATLVAIILWLILAVITFMFVGEWSVAFLLSFLGVAGFMFFYGRVWNWGIFRAPAAWFLGIYLLWFDVRPVVWEMLTPSSAGGGGVAHWAHIGGFLFGMLYAVLIGSQEEGKTEYLQEDAEKAFAESDLGSAVTRAQSLLAREPNNAAAYEVLAKSFDRQKNEDAALDNYELAIQNYLRSGERDQAARIYLVALENHPRFIMPATVQLVLGNQMAKNGQYEKAAEALVKIPYTFPEAPEGEVSSLRCAQIYLQHLNQPQRALTLLQLFMQRYPESPWMPQAQQAWSLAQNRLSPAESANTAP